MSSSALVLAAVAVTQVAAAAKWNIGNFKPRAEVAVDPNGRLPQVELDAALHSSLLALRLVEKAEQGATPEEAMAEAQKLLDADDQHDASIWKHAVLSLGGSQTEAEEIAKPIHHSLTEKGDGDAAADGGAQDGDYVLLLMQHDLQQLDLAQSAFADALTVSEDTVKEITPHVKLYDDWTRLHGGLVQLHGRTANADNGTMEASEILEGLGGADRAARNFTANATAAANTDADAGSADGENVLRLMEHDMALLQRAENEYSNAIGTMERTAAEVKKHEELYADFVKALQEHHAKGSKLTLGNSVNGPAKVDLAEVQQLVSSIAKATAFCQDAAVKAKKAQEDGTAPPVSKLLDQTRQLWAGAMALMEAAAQPQQQAAALVELRALMDPSSEVAKATKERVLHKIRSEQPDTSSSPDERLAHEVDSADGIVADVTTAERHMKEQLDSITPP